MKRMMAEMGILVLLTNMLCSHFLYTGAGYQDELWRLSECAGRVLLVMSLPFKGKFVTLGIATEIARTIYNIGWAAGFNDLNSSVPQYAVPAVVVFIYFYLDNDGPARTQYFMGILKGRFYNRHTRARPVAGCADKS